MSTNKIFFQNHLYNEHQDNFLKVINFLKNNLIFQEYLNNFWKIHKKDYDGRISLISFKEHLYLIYKFMFPYFERNTLEELINEEVNQMTSTDNQQEVILDQYYEFFAKFCIIWIETPSLQAALKFLSLLYERTTKLVYRNINNTNCKYAEVDYHIEVIFFEKQEAEKLVKITEIKQREDIIYFQEKLVLNQYLKEQVELDFEIVSERIFMKSDEIIPLGFSLESVLLHLMNMNYEVDIIEKNGKNFIIPEHFTTKQCSFMSRIQLIANITSKTIADLKNYLEYHLYFSCAVLDDKPSDSSSDEYTLYRLNQVLNRKYMFKKLKNKHSLNPQFYNIVSAFYKFDDYEIDLIDKLHKEWNDRSETHEDLTPYPRFDTLDLEDQQLSSSNLHYISIKQKLQYMQISSFGDFLTDPQTSSIEPWLPSLNFHNHVSKYDCLPLDNEDPYIEDILEYSNKPPLQILVISKPKIGRTAFSADFAKKMDIIHIELELSIQKIFKKIKEFDENPELDEENNPKDFLSPLEKDIIAELKAGMQISNDALLELLNLELQDPLVSLKGYILDIPLVDYIDFSWISQILNGNLRIPQISCRYFTHVINLEVTDAEIHNFVNLLKENLEDYRIYSEYDRILLKNSKKKPDDEEDNPDNEEKKPLLDENLLSRPGDTPEFIDPLLEKFSTKTLKKLQALTSHLTKSQYIDIKAAGLPIDQLTEIAIAHLSEYRDPLRPLPIRLDPGSDANLKELLTQGLDDGRPARKWTGFYQIDPIELYNGKVIAGKADFAVSFAGRVFLFEKEENILEFIKDPCKYIKNRPKMPKSYNISICGPHLTGKKTYAELLSKLYGWKIVDVEKLIGESLLDQKSFTQYTASNPTINKIHCSEAEWKELIKGNALSTRNILPIVLHNLGFKLQKRPPKPPPKEGEEGYEEYKAAEEAKEALNNDDKLKEKPGSKKGPRPAALNNKKKEEKIDEKDEENKEPVIEDLALKDISQLPDEYGQYEAITGNIFINFPINEEQVQALKDFNINIDKVIYLVDTNEEETEAGKVLSSRGNFEAFYSLENELAFSDASLKGLQELLTEDIVKIVSIIGTIEEVFNRIRTIIDPFYIRVDEDSSVRVPADLAEGDEPIPWGDYGPYCPITLQDERWIVPGKEDQELQVQGKRYRFYNEKELKSFKASVEKYASNYKKCIPAPRIMFFGVRGSGLKTQLRLLNEKYKISIYDLKEEMLKQLNINKQQRKNIRFLLKGFKPKEINEEGGEVEDQEILEESPEFDKKLQEIAVLSAMLSQLNEVFINGNFYDLEEDTIQTPLLEMLQEAKRLPELAVFLKVSDKNLLNRVFDEAKIKTEYNKQINELKKKRDLEKQEAKRLAKEQALENGEGEGEGEEPPQEQEEEPEPPIEEDPEAPKLEEMLNEQRDKFLQRREADIAKIDELVEGFTAANIPVLTLDADRDIMSVFKGLVWDLKNFLEGRENKLEKFQVINVPEEKVSFYKACYHIKKSRFGDYNVLEPSYLPIIQDYSFIYRDRLYFFENEEKRKLAGNEPLKYLKSFEAPLDINYKPAIFLIGKPKSGVSSLAKIIEKNLGVVRVKISKIFEELALNHNSSKLGYEALQLLRLGNSPNEEMCVELIAQRVQQRDCIERGWILDSFPQTITQAKLLANKGIIPNSVFSMQLNDLDIKTRVASSMKEMISAFPSLKQEYLQKKQEEAEENNDEDGKKKKNSTIEYEFEYKNMKLGYDGYLLHQRLKKNGVEITNLENFYLNNYNNVKFLDGKLSKWGLYERAKNYIQKTIKQRQMLARALVLREPCVVGDLALTQKQILEFYSEYKNYCPVSFKSKQEFVALSYRNKYLTFYNFKLYNINSQKYFEDFKKQPYLYLDKNLLRNYQEMPKIVTFDNILEKGIKPNQEGYDVVELSSNILCKGRKNLLIEYKKKFYVFKNVVNMKNFIKYPQLYSEVKLPAKYLDQKNSNSKRNDIKDSSSSYLENNLANIVMKVLAQLGYNKLKYPTISPQETALKFVALSLKASNPNQNEYYKRKYQTKLQDFLNGCHLCHTFYEEHKKREICNGKEGEWSEWEEENYLKLGEELEAFIRNINSKDKTSYFYEYIR